MEQRVKTVRRRRFVKKPSWGKLAAVAVVIAALAALWRYTPLADVITVDNARSLARAAHETSWSPFVMLALYSPAAFVMFPRPLLTLFAVVAYGPWWGFAVAMTGILLSAMCTYYVGRALPPNTLRNLAGDRFERTTAALRGRGFVAAFAVSVAPVAPFPVVGMVAGAARIRLWQYIAGTAAGMLPGTLATTAFADQLKNALDDPSRINYWVVAAVALVFVLLLAGARRWIAAVQRDAARA